MQAAAIKREARRQEAERAQAALINAKLKQHEEALLAKELDQAAALQAAERANVADVTQVVNSKIKERLLEKQRLAAIVENSIMGPS